MAVSLRDVRRALTELGKLRFGEMRVEDAMHEIVQTTHTIFDVDGAALMLADAEHHLRNAVVSDERLRHLEELQIRHQEGPCIAAFDDKELVGAEDLTGKARARPAQCRQSDVDPGASSCPCLGPSRRGWSRTRNDPKRDREACADVSQLVPCLT